MKKILFTLFGIFIALNVNGQDKTDYPMINYNLDEYNGIATIVIEPVDPETDAIYWRFAFEEGEWTDWMIYDGPLCFNAIGRYQLETYATSPGKIDSDIVCLNFVIQDPDDMYHVQIADFGADGIYYRITSDSTVIVSLNDTYDYDYTEPFGWELNSVGPYAGDVIIPPTVEYDGITYTVEGIDNYAFINCALASITLPNTLKTICNRAFLHATIESGSIFIPASVTTIEDGAFADCYNLNVQVDENNPVYDSRDNCNAIIETATNTLVVGFNSTTIPPTVTAIANDAFAGDAYSGFGYYTGCSFTDLIIPNSVKTIGNRAFYYCSNLQNITLSDELTSIGDWAFFMCGLKHVTIPNNVTTIGNGAFSYCFNLSSIDIPNSVTSIGSEAFQFSGLKSVIIPNSITSINDAVFNGCEALTSVTIPNTVTTIGSEAFNRTALTSITIPGSVTSIGDNAFGYCENLTKVTCQATTPPAQNGAFFSYYGNIYEQATLYVPFESLEAYQNHASWRYFTHIVPFIGAGPGDINGDGSVAISDATNLIDMLLGGDELPAWADVDGDGTVGIKDVTTLIDMLLGN